MNTFTRIVYLAGVFALASILLISCGEKEKKVQPPPEIPVVEVIQKDVPLYRQFVGQVYGHSDIPIRARVAGFLEGIHFDEGMPVKKGQLLYSIDPSEYQAKVSTQESHLAEARTEMTKSKSDLDRIEPLAKINAVSKSDLDAARANYDASRAYVEAQKANVRYAKINLGYCWIKSPLDGLIGKTNARIGEFVGKDPNPVILNTVSTIDSVRVEFYIAEAQYIRLARELQKVRDYNREEAAKREPNLSLILSDGSVFKYKGYTNFINREVDPQTGSLLVQTTFPNPDKLLKPGQYAKVVVKMKDVNDALLIPQRCVMELQGQYSVYVVNDENIIENRQIKAGDTVGDLILVVDGLSAGDKVVIDALQKVGTGMIVNPELTEFESQSNNQF